MQPALPTCSEGMAGPAKTWGLQPGWYGAVTQGKQANRLNRDCRSPRQRDETALLHTLFFFRVTFFFWPHLTACRAFPVAQPPAMQETQETQVQSLSWEDSLEEGRATHSSSLAWRISRTEEPGGLQSMGLQRVGHD